MKSISGRLVFLCALLAIIVLAPVGARAGWEPYDGFDSGTTFNSDLWKVDVSGQGNSVSVVNKQAKFVLVDPTGAVRLRFNNPESIKGVRAKVKVATSSGDFSARIVGRVAMTPGGDIISQGIQARPQSQAFRTFVEVDNPSGNTLYTLFENYFKNPITIAGKWFTMTMNSPNPKTYTFSVTGQGSCSYKPTATFVEGGKTFLYIGIKSPHGEATGTAYFDDIYVLR